MTHFEQIELLASDLHGYFTASRARGLGILSCELDRWMKRGRLENPARGVYRLANYPSSEAEPYVLAVLSAGEGAFLFGESVLAMLNLVPAEAGPIRVGSSSRVRRKRSARLQIVHVEAGCDVVNYEGLAVQPLAEAIRAARGRVRHDRRMRAVEEGFRQGFLEISEYRSLRKELQREAAS